MFSGFFNYDNPVWRFIGKFFDVLILNILWVICSIPVVTVGASTTAVYYVTLKLVRDEEGSTIKSFFKSFKENFKQSTAIWLILLVVGSVIGVDLYFFIAVMTGSTKLRTLMIAAFIGFAVIYAGLTLFVFPLQCRFYNPVKKTLFNAFFISIRHFLQTLGLLAIDLGLPVLALTVAPILQPVFFLFGFPLIAFMNSYVLVGIFDKYMPKREEPEDRFGMDDFWPDEDTMAAEKREEEKAEETETE